MMNPDSPISDSIDIEPPQKITFWKSFWGELLQTILLAGIFYLAIDAIFERVMVLNISMQPTLIEGDLILVNKLAYKWGDFQTGDVVIFHNPNYLEEDYIKRLIGKPGDRIDVQRGVVSVNGVQLDEPYIAAPPDYEGNWIVPSNSIFVLGDNRISSSDSHSWGFVPVEDLVGRALFVYWPLDRLQVLSHPDYSDLLQNTFP